MKIKLFVDAHIFDSVFQGTSTYIKGLYSALVEDEDFEITLGAYDIAKLQLLFNDGRFKFIKLPSKSKFKRLAFDIPNILREQKFDYAHFQYITPFIKTCKYINTIHDLLFLEFPEYFPLKYRLLNKLLFRYSTKKTDILCTVSQYSKTVLNKHFKINSEEIILTPNAIEIYSGEFVDVKKKYNLQKYVLFVSRFEPRKNHYSLLKAFIELNLSQQGYKLVFIGRINDVKTMKYDAYFQKLTNVQRESILYFENISHKELCSFYNQTELFVYPSFAEGFGIPPLEAAMLNCKVICSNQTAMKDFDFFGMYLFDPNNEDELKFKITKTLADQNYPYETIKAAILKKYNWSSISQILTKRLKENYITDKI